MPRFKKGSKEALEWAKKMRDSRGKKEEDKPGVDKPEVKPKGVVYCPSCLKKGKKVVMTSRGEDTLVCNICQSWVKKEND